jgi:xanthine/uracil/vitamin C permease (AzgA family)
MRSLLLALGAGLGSLLLFFALLEGFHAAVREAAGSALADHSLRFCPNWLLGLVTGALAVGLLWWVAGSAGSGSR